ncbi:MAG: tetratricopeptide repeat protein [Deltaproteobacteria bacterium]|nr:MAG: tetratricopeptide repeat protein [Deltaproteobacteria bacterium]
MQSENANQPISSDLSQIQGKIEEAELYLTQGLFEEARQIYQNLLDHIGPSSQEAGINTSAHHAGEMQRSFIKEQLALIDRQEADFLGKPPRAEPEKPAVPGKEGAALFNRGWALLDIGIFADAIQQFHSAARLNYRPVECLMEIGKAHIQLGQHKKGIKVLEEASRRKDISAEDRDRLLGQMARAYEAAADKKRALELYRQLAVRDPYDEEAASKVQSLREEGHRYQLNMAKVHLQNGQFPKAIETLRSLQQKKEAPGQKLVPVYEQIMQQDPSNLDAVMDLVEICKNQGNLLQASQYLERVQEARPQDGWCQQQLTDIYTMMLDSGAAGPNIRLKLAGHLLRSDQLARALEEYLEVMLEDGAYKMAALNQLGEALLERQDYDRLLEILGDACPWVESTEEGADALNYYYLLGIACEKKHFYDQAQAYFQRAVSIDPDHKGVRAKVENQSKGPLISHGKSFLPVRLPESLEYQIQEDLGQDEIHQVFKVREVPGGDFRLAKTLLHNHSGSGKIKNFVAQWAYQQVTMENRNIIQVLDVAGREGQFYIITEDLPGSLEELLKEKTHLPLAAAVCMARGLLNALAYAHSHRGTDDTLRKIFHLALNPKRVFISADGVVPKIADFGLTLMLEKQLGWAPNYQDLAPFQLQYLAPEQFDRVPSRMPDKMKQAADLYTFGVLFYQMVTGKVPFEGPSPDDFKTQHAERYPVPPRVFISSIPAKLDEAILKCLHKDPKKRWRTPTELDLALEKIHLG